MNRFFMLTLPFLLTSAAIADQVSTFDDISLPAAGYLNNAGPSGYFVSGGNSFNNSYDPTYGTWSGWAISNNTNTTTPGYTNQYSAITGSGAGGSSNYAVAYTFGNNTDPFHPSSSYVNLAAGTNPGSIEVTNTTYDYLSMEYGDQFAKKFGAGDYFELTITGYSGLSGTGSIVGPAVDFYLADFLGGNAYIVDTWQTIDLTSLAGARSLVFGLISTDNDPTYGQNTPSYFAADNLITLSSVPEPSSIVLLATGLLALLALRRSRRRTTAALFFGFPAVSETQTTTQVGGFGSLDASNLHDLAGKYIAGYGTGFDLSELAGVSPLLNINDIIDVRVTDVVGSINPMYGTRDSLGNLINDPWPTPFTSSGFDLNGIGVINEASVPEPSSIVMIVTGLVVAGTASRRRRTRANFFRPRESRA